MKKLILLPLILLTFILHSQIGPITEICVATVDTGSTYNTIVWERAAQNSVNPIDSIKIYRVTLLGADSLVGVVHWDSLSQFDDLSADPNLRPYRYRISGVDDQGVEGPMSLPHQTMHFGLLAQGDSIRLRWSPYIGKPFSVYDCMIDSAGSPSGWEWVNSTSNNIDTNWWDKATPADWSNLNYLVKLSGMTQCSATKAQDHNTTRSNRATITEPNPNGIYEESMIKELTIYPNPVNQSTKLVFSSKSWAPIDVFVTDAMGRRVKSYNPIKVLGQYNMSLDLANYNSGLYHIVLIQNNRVYTKPLLKL